MRFASGARPKLSRPQTVINPMHRHPLIAAFLVLALLAGDVHAQAEIPELPVRYDTNYLSPEFHRERRTLVLDALPENALAVFFSWPEAYRGGGGELPYHQDRDLYYLTGSEEESTVLVLAPGGIEVDGQTHREVLFVPERTEYTDVWVGRRFGSQRAQEELGLERAVSNERFEEIITAAGEQDGIRFYHLPLPDGYRRGSELASQLQVFEHVAQPLERILHRDVARALGFALRAEDGASFSRVQRAVRSRIGEFAGDEPGIDVMRQLVDARDLASWRRWAAENIETRYADGQLLRNVLNELRMQKTDEEMELLRRSIEITAQAHREAMKTIRPGMHEYEIQGIVEHVFMQEGAERPGFNSIVASGENSVILHYSTNRRQMEDGDVVVIDIGAEYRGYVADVTRTIPVNGRYSNEQRAIYELVLKAQQAGIDAAVAGAPFSEPGRVATEVIAEGLMELGLIDRPQEVRRFFMHGTSHYLGLYVHDVGDYGPLQPGQAITVEPGIYISPAEDVDPRWWNIGVRIEDGILITDGDPVLLSGDAPRSVEDIEALMAQRR
jgi:Xaa-Pro aminopeptidase